MRQIILLAILILSDYISAQECIETSILCVPSEYTTVQACIDAAGASQTCYISPGVYNESIRMSRAGEAGRPVTLKGDHAVVGGIRLSAANLRIEGMEVTYIPGISPTDAGIYLSGADNAEIIGNYIHHNPGIGIWLHHGSPSDGVRIIKNSISYTGWTDLHIGEAGIIINGEDVLVEGNDISHVGDFTNAWGRRIIIRNNTFHDCYITDFPDYFNTPGADVTGHHVDGIQYFSSAGRELRYLLFENNIVRDSPLNNIHGGIFRDTLGLGDSDVIYRHNTFRNIGSQAIQINPFKDLRAVHNTIVNAVTYGARATYAIQVSATGGVASSGVKILNNLFYNSSRQVSWAGPYVIDSASLQGFAADYNMIFLNGAFTHTGAPPEAHGIIADPLFTRSLGLMEGSPAIDAAGPLTTVVSVAGTVLVVGDPGFFQDGWAGQDADWISVGSAVAQISSIDYAADSITLDRTVSASIGDPVYLYKDSSGRIVLYGEAPDIGAHEYQSSCSEADLDCDGTVDDRDLLLIIDQWKRGERTIQDLLLAIKEWKG